MILKLELGLVASLSALSLVTVACRGDVDPGTSESASTSTTDPVTDGGSDTGVPTTSESASSSTSGDEGTGTTTGDTTAEPTTNNSQGFITTMTDSGSEDGGPLPNGSECSSDDDCVSMNCFSLLGGMLAFCADCNEDQDCVDAGTGTACTLDGANQNAICTDGAEGSTCMSDAACQSGFCEAVIEIPIPGFIPNTCSECGESADCTMDQICSPSFDVMMFSGQKSCVEPGSVMNNQLCPSAADGDEACMSGHCTEATIQGIVPVNICGECASDADCDPGQTCTPAMADGQTFSGSICE